MITRPKGYIRGRYDDRSARYIARATDLPVPSYADLERHRVTGPPYQHGASSCTGFGVRQAIRVRRRFLGLPDPDVSIHAIYYGGRARVDGWARVTDSGASALDCWQSLRELGEVSADECPYDERAINVAPTPDAYRDAVGRVIEYRWLRSRSTTLQIEMTRHLRAGYPIAFAIPVDAAFERLGEFDPAWNISGESLGWHYVCAIGARDDGVAIQNSWPQWGKDGLAVVGWSTVCSYAEDLVIPAIEVDR